VTELEHIEAAQGLGAPAYSYSTYGMQVVSDIELPELASVVPGSVAEPRSLRIRRAPVELPENARSFPTWYEFGTTETRFYWQTVGAFSVNLDGTEILCEPAESVSDDLIAFPLLGPILFEALRRQGHFVLHASAVALGGQAVVLMADKGTGKSTSAAALLNAGGKLLADDLVAFTPDGEVLSGFGQVKLSDAALEAHRPQKSVARGDVHAAIDKKRVQLPRDATAEYAAPAVRLYILERGEGEMASTADVAANQSLPAILRFSYGVRFGENLLSGEPANRHFRDAVSLAGRVKVRILRLPATLDAMTTLADAIRADLNTDRAMTGDED
tara:strand:- start:1034 stop:2020 length:987 start_codon:yes stop_codon:yes gene_type:complete